MMIVCHRLTRAEAADLHVVDHAASAVPESNQIGRRKAESFSCHAL